MIEQIEIAAKYSGYIDRQKDEVERAAHYESLKLPPDLDYMQVAALSIEVRQKLDKHRPETLGLASRISGVTPAAISLLLVHLKKRPRPREPACGQRPGNAGAPCPQSGYPFGLAAVPAACAMGRGWDWSWPTPHWRPVRISRPDAKVGPRLQPDRSTRSSGNGDPPPAGQSGCSGALRRHSAAGATSCSMSAPGQVCRALSSQPVARIDGIDCVDTVAKKAAFIQQAATTLNVPNLRAAQPG